jgi:hypothetical protein
MCNEGFFLLLFYIDTQALCIKREFSSLKFPINKVLFCLRDFRILFCLLETNWRLRC